METDEQKFETAKEQIRFLRKGDEFKETNLTK